jgi:hypothetical protein
MLSKLRSLLEFFASPRAFAVLAPALCLLLAMEQPLFASTLTSTALAISANGSTASTVTAKTVVTLTATVATASAPVTTGQVNFCDASALLCTDIHLLGTAQLTSGGTAILHFTPGPGAHGYNAVYVGTTNLSASTSPVQQLTVQGTGTAPTTTTLTYSGSPGDYSLTATVPKTGSAIPSGAVSFLDTDNANFVLGTAVLGTGGSSLRLATGATYSTGEEPWTVVTADFNGDGKLDIATTAFDSLGTAVPGSVVILMGNGDGTFTVAPTIATPEQPCCLVTGDFNNDGKPDLAFASLQDGSITILLGNGDGTFSPGSTISGSFADVFDLEVGDFNGDGNLDLVASNPQTEKVLVLLGNGDGTFTPVATPPSTGNNPIAIAVGDFNQDGVLDMVVCNLISNAGLGASSSLTVLLGNGDGTFTPAPTVTIPGGSEYVYAADFNLDGKLDLVVANVGDVPQSVTILLGNGDGTFTPAGSPLDLPYLGAITVGDFNGDGIPDLGAFAEVLAPTYSKNVAALLGNGDGTFTSVTANDVYIPQFGVAGDFNGDGLWDIALGAQDGGVTIFLSTATGPATATVNHISPVGTGVHYVDAAYSGDPNYAMSLSGTVPLVAERVPTALALTVDPATSTESGQQITLTGFVHPNFAQNHNASGTVAFSTGGGSLGTANVGSGFATFNTSALGAGTDTLGGAYSGDTNFLPSTASTTHVVTSGYTTTTTTLTCSPTTINLGSTSLFSALVTSSNGTPTGSVTFTDGTTTLGQPTLTNGAATYTYTGTTAGTHAITATYVPTGNFAASSGTCSITVNSLPATTTTLAIYSAGAAVSTLQSGSVATLVASVTSSGTAVSPGQVQFCDAAAPYCTDIHLLGTAQLTAAGTATLRFLPGLGNHSYKAIFLGSKNDTASASPAAPLAVSGTDATTTTLSASGSPGNYALTATISSAGVPTPTGTVSFDDTTNANYTLATGQLSTGSVGISFLTMPLLSTGKYPTYVVSGDFNNDGIPDLAITNKSSHDVTILLGKGDGTFSAGIVLPINGDPVCLVVGDFNHDGNADLAISNAGGANNAGGTNNAGGMNLYLGRGDGTFTAGVMLPAGDTPGTIVTGDFNNDGNADLAIANSLEDAAHNKTLSLYLGNGDGTFIASTLDVTVLPFYLAVGDFNGDGKTDLVAFPQNDQSSSGTGEVLLGNGDGTFTVGQSFFLADAFALGVVAADLNGDGKLDLAIATVSGGTNGSILFFGNGDGTFAQAPAPSLDGISYAIAVGDFNQDGYPDIAAPGVDQYVAIALGSASGVFSDLSLYPPIGNNPSSIALTDFDGDGVPDIAVTNSTDNTLSVLLTRRTVTVTATGISPVGTGTHYADAVYSGDTNYSGSTSNTVPLLAQQVATTITLSAPPGGLVGQPLTLTATLQPSLAQNHAATGTVTFFYGSTSLGTSQLSAGAATFSTSSLPIGSDSLACTYSGDANFAGASCNTVQAIINSPPPPADFTLTGPTSITFRTESTGAGTLTLASLNGFSGPITLTCNPPLPVNYLCTLAPSTPTLAADATASSTVTLQPNLTSSRTPRSSLNPRSSRTPRSGRTVLAMLFPLALLAFAPRRRRRLTALLTLAVLATITTALTACGPDIYVVATPPGTYPITVTATGAAPGTSAPITHTLPFNIVITP